MLLTVYHAQLEKQRDLESSYPSHEERKNKQDVHQLALYCEKTALFQLHSIPQATHEHTASEEVAIDGPNAHGHETLDIYTSSPLLSPISLEKDSVCTETKVYSSEMASVLPEANEIAFHEVKGYKKEQVTSFIVCAPQSNILFVKNLSKRARASH